MTELERLMDEPLSVAKGEDPLYHLIGDDTFHDMLAGMSRHADCRPVVAITLDEWVNWSSDSQFKEPWEEGVRDRGRALVALMRDADVAPHSKAFVLEDTPEAAVGLIAMTLGVETPDPGRFEAVRGTAPATHAVLDASDGRLYRVDAFYGVVFEAPDEERERLRTELFGAASPAP